MSGIIKVSSTNENSLQAAVASTGPVAVAVDASSNAFKVRTKLLFVNMNVKEILKTLLFACVYASC